MSMMGVGRGSIGEERSDAKLGGGQRGGRLLLRGGGRVVRGFRQAGSRSPPCHPGLDPGPRFLPSRQNGFTTASPTIASAATAGTSLTRRNVFPASVARPPASFLA